MALYLYSELAAAVQARRNCADSNNTQWFENWSDHIETLMEQMPSGSGFDSGTKLDLDLSHAEKLVFTTSFHHMAESGMCAGWSDHTVTVTPTFGGFNLRVSGRNVNEIKDYIGDTFYEALRQTVEITVRDSAA